jgi:hypothetical protein
MQSKIRSSVVLLAILLVPFFAGAATSAENSAGNNGTVSGSAKDTTGAALQGARILLQPTDATVASDATGNAATQRVFADIADSNDVAVIDAQKNSISAHWKLIGSSDNVPLAYDSEHTDAMDLSQVGWGRVDAAKLRELMQIHTANEDVTHGTPYIARAESSNLLTHVLDSLEQAVDGKVVAGALSRPEDRLLIVVGHDTNLANISGALNLSWLIDGRLNDTPPGGALVFELWRTRGSTDYDVRTFYTAQTLEQMRNAAPLDLRNPPERVAIFVPGCSGADLSCSWKSFQQTIRNVTNDRSVQ